VRKNQKPNACGGEEGEVEAPSPASPSPGPGLADPVVNFLQTQSVYLGRHFLRVFRVKLCGSVHHLGSLKKPMARW